MVQDFGEDTGSEIQTGLEKGEPGASRASGWEAVGLPCGSHKQCGQ